MEEVEETTPASQPELDIEIDVSGIPWTPAYDEMDWNVDDYFGLSRPPPLASTPSSQPPAPPPAPPTLPVPPEPPP